MCLRSDFFPVNFLSMANAVNELKEDFVVNSHVRIFFH